ncbi:TonB-dependent receptor [Granulicella sibirica]|uniref:Oar protein n=1 Tax=Granulicella sibirica TaxID=2479048 RepID=A0A4Q0STF7_9BACT|nr:carboxypeptidase regulatory-like domain-containing protein [Granulicella sibirica]RXH54253.1 Oar protein [Granulicella sibirica]
MHTLIRRFTFSATLLGTFILFAGGSTPGFSQSQSINGTIRGIVTDASGGLIANATITITNLDTGYHVTVQSSDAGVYIAASLPIGTYSVKAEAQGFAAVTQSGIHLDAGTSATVDEKLNAGSVATVVEVTSDAPIIEPARFDMGRTISVEETQNLPLTSRNPYNFILFQPGVSGHPNPENGIPRTVNTNGLVDRVNYQLDGMVDTETDRYGLRLFAISDSYVREVQTISNSAAPEFGNTAGIVYNVISNSGTNKVHGQAQYIWRPKAASSCPLLQNCDLTAVGGKVKPDLHVDDFVGNLGGPVVKDRFFLFGAYEHLKRANPTANTINVATQQALIATGVSASDFNTAPQVQRTQWVDVRGDFIINKKNSAFIRYNYFRNNYPFNTNVGGTFAISSASDFQDRAHIIGAQVITTFTANLLNEFRGSIPYRNEHHVPDALTGPGPAISIAASGSFTAATFGGPAVNGSGDKYQEKIPSFNDNVTLIHGAHTYKVGFGFQKNNDTQLADIFTQFNFASVAQYISAKSGATPTAYSSVQASIGQPGAAYHSVFFDLFAQDTWQLRRDLLVSYGLRYDQYRAPTPPAGEPFSYTQSFRTPEANFAPRLGIAYSPIPTTVIRLNAGIFYESTPTNTWYNPLYNNGAAGTGSFIATVSGGGACSPSFPNTPQTVAANCLPTQSIYALTPQFKNEYVWNANLQVAQQLTSNDQLTLGYTMTNGRNFQFLRNLNLINPTSFLADGRPVFSTTVSAATRLDPRFNNITLIDTGSNTSYNALTATYEHRLSAGLTTSASYTWSHSISDTPEANSYEFSNAIEDPTNRKRDRGPSSVNRPNSMTISAVYTPKTKFENKYVNGIFTNNNFAFLGNFTSGDEQNITVSPHLNNDSLSSSRPLFVGRNSVRAPKIAQADLRYTRTFATIKERFSPKLLIEGNNILNHTNVTSINTTATVVTAANSPLGPIGTVTAQPSFAPTSSVLEARILQFGLKIDF